MRLPVTLCISTRNEAGQLAACIDSVRTWVSEIVIVDMESSDETVSIAESYGATIVRVPAAGWAEPGRQSGIEAATQPWMLVLDADERAAPELQALVTSYVDRSDVGGVWLPRQNFWFGWWVPWSGLWPDWQLRLFRRDVTTWPGDRTHIGPVVDGRVEHAPARAENALIHESNPSISAAVEKMNHYTDLEADRLVREGQRPSVLRLFGVPALRFAEPFFFKRGYRAGRYGLAIALLSFCYWLVAELKVWERGLTHAKLPSGSVALSETRTSSDQAARR